MKNKIFYCTSEIKWWWKPKFEKNFLSPRKLILSNDHLGWVSTCPEFHLFKIVLKIFHFPFLFQDEMRQNIPDPSLSSSQLSFLVASSFQLSWLLWYQLAPNYAKGQLVCNCFLLPFRVFCSTFFHCFCSVSVVFADWWMNHSLVEVWVWRQEALLASLLKTANPQNKNTFLQYEKRKWKAGKQEGICLYLGLVLAVVSEGTGLLVGWIRFWPAVSRTVPVHEP